MIYISLFVVAFMVATIIPFGSEAYFITLLTIGEYNHFLLLIAASLGNILGSLFNWIGGYYINYFIRNGVKGITFKHNLSHKDSCYEIATSDIGICWCKNGWGDNGEISTTVKEYDMYSLEIINDLKI